jgi:hypothetical protein
MGNPLEGVDTSDQPYVVVSSDTHAGLQVEAYRDYLDAKFLPQFDEWVVARHEHRRMVEEINGEYVEKWESENADGLPGAYDPVVRDRCLDADGNGALDCYSQAPITKRELLELMASRFGMTYEIVPAPPAVNITGEKPLYYSDSRRAAALGYAPAYSSASGIAEEVAAILAGS